MIEFHYIPPDEVDRRHREPSRQQDARASIPQRQPQQRNVETILSLGDVRYVGYRNRAFRCPPVPYKLGQRVLDLQVKATMFSRQVVQTGKKEPADEFFKTMSQLTKLLWSHLRPTGKIKRALWHLGLLRNPLRYASEAEVNQITDFFLKGRMTSSVRSMSEAEVTQ